MTTDAFAHPEFLIDTETLERQLGDPGLRVLDCTTHLIPDPKTTYQIVPGRADFEKGHIPGAQFVDLQADLSDNGHRFSVHEAFRRGFRRGDAPVRHRRGDAGRDLQHDNAAMGDAGVVAVAGIRLRRRGGARRRLAEMGREKRPVETGAGKAASAGNFAVREERPLMVGKEEVLQAIGDSAVCTLNALRPRCMPAPAATITAAWAGSRAASTCRRRICSIRRPAPSSRPRTAARFEAVGAFDKQVITYCGGGIAASADALALVMLGHSKVRLYDASMSEWANDPTLPMETG